MQPEALNKKAIQIINRVRDKLTGESTSSSPYTQCPSGRMVMLFRITALAEQAEQHSFQMYCLLKIRTLQLNHRY